MPDAGIDTGTDAGIDQVSSAPASASAGTGTRTGTRTGRISMGGGDQGIDLGIDFGIDFRGAAMASQAPTVPSPTSEQGYAEGSIVVPGQTPGTLSLFSSSTRVKVGAGI